MSQLCRIFSPNFVSEGWEAVQSHIVSDSTIGLTSPQSAVSNGTDQDDFSSSQIFSSEYSEGSEVSSEESIEYSEGSTASVQSAEFVFPETHVCIEKDRSPCPYKKASIFEHSHINHLSQFFKYNSNGTVLYYVKLHPKPQTDSLSYLAAPMFNNKALKGQNSLYFYAIPFLAPPRVSFNKRRDVGFYHWHKDIHKDDYLFYLCSKPHAYEASKFLMERKFWVLHSRVRFVDANHLNQTHVFDIDRFNDPSAQLVPIGRFSDNFCYLLESSGSTTRDDSNMLVVNSRYRLQRSKVIVKLVEGTSIQSPKANGFKGRLTINGNDYYLLAITDAEYQQIHAQ